MDVKAIREAFEKWLDGPYDSEATWFATDYDRGGREGSSIGYKNMAFGFYSGYKAALSTVSPDAIRAEARAEGAKAFKRMMLDASRPIVWPLIEGVWGVFCNKGNIEPGAILADEPKRREAEATWHTDPPAKEGLYLVEVSAKFSAPSPWHETAFYRKRDGWALPKTSEGEEVLAWMEIPRHADLECKPSECDTREGLLYKSYVDDMNEDEESLQQCLDRMDGYGIDNECGSRG